MLELSKIIEKELKQLNILLGITVGIGFIMLFLVIVASWGLKVLFMIPLVMIVILSIFNRQQYNEYVLLKVTLYNNKEKAKEKIIKTITILQENNYASSNISIHTFNQTTEPKTQTTSNTTTIGLSKASKRKLEVYNNLYKLLQIEQKEQDDY